MTKVPCLKCENAGCGKYHDECEKYKEFRVEQEKLAKVKSEFGAKCRLNKKGRISPNSPLKIKKYGGY